MKTVFAAQDTDLVSLFDSLEPFTTVVLASGIYRQKLEINVSDITVCGSGAVTVITNDDYAKKLDEYGREYNTFRTYTVAVCADRVKFSNLTIENTALNPSEKGQEVALTVCGNDFLAENCVFSSTQDTLFCGPLPHDLITRYDGFLKDKLRISSPCRQIYRQCRIEGSVDFIFGCGDCLFDECEIVSVFDGRDVGYVSAPAHDISQEIGFVFGKCSFVSGSPLLDGKIYLARPWRDYGKSSFIDCIYGSHISPLGFDKWNATNRDKTARFAEHGVVPDGRVPWSRTLSDAEAQALLDHFR